MTLFNPVCVREMGFAADMDKYQTAQKVQSDLSSVLRAFLVLFIRYLCKYQLIPVSTVEICRVMQVLCNKKYLVR